MVPKGTVTLTNLEEVVAEIIAKFRPKRVILFGSEARGEAKEGSDVDLLVVMETGELSSQEMAQRIKAEVPTPKRPWRDREIGVLLDLHVFSSAEFEAALRRRSVILTTAVMEGVVLYEAPDVTPLRALLAEQQGWEGEGMKPETKEWVEKAEGDRTIALRALQPPEPVYDAVCFHAQQCAEKYLKAFLEERGILFPKTHKLVELVELAGGELSELEGLRSELAELSEYAVAPRYIGFQATREQAEEALQVAEKVRSVIRTKLGL